MQSEQDRLASALHAAADLLIEHEHNPEVLDEAHDLVSRVNELLATGPLRSLEQRGLAFASDMIAPFGGVVPDEGGEFEAFRASPYSGSGNALRPKSVTYRRVGDEVHGDVLLGTALEGAPGRAHGGATAAIFDDAMGAVQRIVGVYGYTRTLEITYRAPLPTNKLVLFRCRLTNANDRTFTMEGEALHGETTVATAVAVFTTMGLDRVASGR